MTRGLNKQISGQTSPGHELVRQNFIIASKYGHFKEFSTKKFCEISSARTVKAGKLKQERLDSKLRNMTTLSERNQELKENVGEIESETQRNRGWTQFSIEESQTSNLGENNSSLPNS